ncbi:MAG: o-succinylbenzoate--CoA ligase [Phycicoccus sp.]
MTVEPLPVPAGAAAPTVLARLAEALAGGRPVAPFAASGPPPPVLDDDDLPADLAVVVGTSGSTGIPKRALLGAAALAASAQATHHRLGGPGQWLLALPAHHVGGLQVLLRSLAAGTPPVAVDTADGFTPSAFADAVALLDTRIRRYTSLVPTQLGRLLDDPGGPAALRHLDAVLVGGAALPRRLRARARESGVPVIPTYGMSETAGGCVYDGRPLDGTVVAIDPDGRVRLGGATLAHGYLGRRDLTAAAFSDGPDGTRWFRTDDVGRLDDDGLLHVDGRVDDLVITGAMKVAPRVVEDAVATHVAGVREVLVVGVPDTEWGEVVGALLVLDPGSWPRSPTADDVRARLRGVVPDHALPRRVRTVDALPSRGGKPDRRAARAVLGAD